MAGFSNCHSMFIGRLPVNAATIGEVIDGESPFIIREIYFIF